MEMRQHEDDARERLAYGRQEIERFKALNEIAKEEYAIKSQIRTQKEVAVATKRISELDLSSPDWMQEYSQIMADHPLAHDDKFLHQQFAEGAKKNLAALARKNQEDLLDKRDRNETGQKILGSKIETSKEIYKTLLNEKTTDQLRQVISQNSKADDDGVVTPTAPDHFVKILGNIKQAHDTVPTPGVIEKHAKLVGDVATYQSELDAATAAIGAIDPKKATTAGKTGLPLREEANQAWNATKANLDGATAELSALRKSYPSLLPKQNPQTPAKSPAQAAQPTPSATPAATPQPSPAPSPAPSVAPVVTPGAKPSVTPNPKITKLYED